MHRASHFSSMFATGLFSVTAMVSVTAMISATAMAEPVLLISIDGLHPDYVLKADQHGLKVPHLRSFVTEGSYATGVVGVVPTVTYPSHTTLVTGAEPALHGIHSNTPFDPLNVNRDGWYWYAEDIHVTTLWQAAKAAELVTASVNWPVTINDPAIDFLLPEFWRASTLDDLKLMRALSHPRGIMETIEAKHGNFIDGYIDTIESDDVRTKFSVELLRESEADFMATHLIALDGEEHRHGPWVPAVYATMESIDAMIGELIDAALANDPDSVVAIVSDHGFIATHTAVNLRSAFVDAELITLRQPLAEFATPVIDSWHAQVMPAGGSAAVILHEDADVNLHQRVLTLLESLHRDTANGIARVISGRDIATTGGFPDADFIVEFAPGYYFGAALRGELLTPATSMGTHGYLPERPEMHATFLIKGRGIAAGRDLGLIDMRQIAPTLAEVLGVSLPEATQEVLEVRKQ